MNILNYLDGNINQSGKILLYDAYIGVGDLLWRTCLFRELKRRNPNMKLYVSSMGNYWKLLLQNNENINGLIDRIGSPPYISGIDYYVSDQVCPHVVSNYARELDSIDALEIWSGLAIRDKSIYYETTIEEDKWAKLFLDKFRKNNNKIVGVQLKSSTWVRTWPPEEVIRFIRMLRYAGFTVVVIDNGQFGFKDDGIINFVGGYSIREVAAIVKQLDLMITPDSGLLHFSGHFRIPTIAIFGGSDPSCRIKYYPTVIPISKGKESCEQWPCWSHSYICNRGVPSPCISIIKAEEIFNIVKEIL